MSGFYRGRALDVATFVRWLGLVSCDWNAEVTFHPNLPSFPRSFPETCTAGTGKGPAWRWAAGAARPASCRLSPGTSAWVPAQLSPGAARGRGALTWISRPPWPCRWSYSEVGRGPWPGWARPGCAASGAGPAAERSWWGSARGREAVVPQAGRRGCGFACLTRVCPSCLSPPSKEGEMSLSASSSAWEGIAFKLVLTAGSTVLGWSKRSQMPLFSVFLLGWLALPMALLQPRFWLSLKPSPPCPCSDPGNGCSQAAAVLPRYSKGGCGTPQRHCLLLPRGRKREENLLFNPTY